MYTDFLTKIKNAQAAKLPGLKTQFSGMDFAIAELLTKHGYIESAEKKGRNPKRIIDVKLKYSDGQGVISDIKFLSKPSRRLYGGYKGMKPALQGYGLTVVSTPKGVMTSMEAKKAKVGGVLLFNIW